MKRLVLFIIFLFLAVASLFIGVEKLPIHINTWSSHELDIFLFSRFPRLISIIIAGAGISICGMIMQSLTQNKFVSPTTAGTMDAARLGVLVSLLFFTGSSLFVKMSVAFLFALAGSFVFMKILDSISIRDTILIPLVGLMFGNILSSIATFFAVKFDLVQNISSWLAGDFSMIMKGRYEILYLSIPLFILAYIYANKFTVSGMGETFASNLGLSYRAVMRIGLVIVSFITATVVLTVGMIPFLGLIVPNIISILKGDHLQKNLMDTALFGASFLLVCDMIGRVILYPYEVSISLVVGIIGSVIFLILLFRRKSYA
ncbi:iron chelate uptake ABC transporter family permease subunit [Listeria aquatica]|uniref:Iron chelate uptake ABC transporter family permease subunit n=1 Tax=Listeria aquatica TaxID=1494960 RepID=A0A841ZR07_9LIST|nr:iron chelate uptake ABC transporter family permease subunit [Listeria aquatica]MBC1521957.1 iron chelate uptake ABC transporter family permease subunit [Listeria aquatica]